MRLSPHSPISCDVVVRILQVQHTNLIDLITTTTTIIITLHDVTAVELIDLLPLAEGAEPETREFLHRLTSILMDYLHTTFDRNEKILDFHHPEQVSEQHRPISLHQISFDLNFFFFLIFFLLKVVGAVGFGIASAGKDD
jgi:hypothetical protein